MSGLVVPLRMDVTRPQLRTAAGRLGRSVAGAAVAALLLVPPSDAAHHATPALSSGIGLIKWGGGSSGSSENWSQLTQTRRYSLISVGPADAGRAARLPGRALLYACGVAIPNAEWSSLCGVPWSTAVARNWLLRDASGNYAQYPGYDYLYLADIGNPSYQQAWIKDMTAVLHRYRKLRGVWIDNIVGHLIAPSSTYPDNATYRAAMLKFIDAVGPALRKKGWYVAAEALMTDTTTPGWRTSFGDQCDGSQPLWWYRRIARDLDGIASEYWEMSWNNGNVRLSGTASCSDQNWDGWERLVPFVQHLHKDFIPLTSGPADASGIAKSAYLKASFLLDYNGGTSAFIYAAGGNSNYDARVDDAMGGAPWTYDLGKPAGAKYRVGSGWRRNFARGTVVINPDPSASQVFALGATYLGGDGVAVDSVTLPPGTAQILRRRTAR